MGRPPIGKTAMTAAERQRRRRAGLAHMPAPAARVTKPVAQPVTEPDDDAPRVTELPNLPPGRTPLVPHDDIVDWADNLDLPYEEIEKLQKEIAKLGPLIARRLLATFADEPEEGARWVVRELGWRLCDEFRDALDEAITEASDAEDEMAAKDDDDGVTQ
jgi:hypothetical protein